MFTTLRLFNQLQSLSIVLSSFHFFTNNSQPLNLQLLSLKIKVFLIFIYQMAFHHSEDIYRKVIQVSNTDNHIHKYNGSYIQFPSIGQAISSNNKRKRFVLKSTTMNVGSKQDELRSYEGLPCTLKIYRVETNSKKIIRWHYRVEIKEYLKRRYHKPTYLLPVEAFQVIRKISYNKQDLQNFFKTQLLYLFKPYYFLDNLKYVLDTERKAIQIHELSTYCRNLIACCLNYGGLDNFVMSSSNVYFEDDFEKFEINYTSFVGIAFINSQVQRVQQSEFLGIQQFLQVYPHLTKSILENGLKINQKMTVKTPIYSKIRSLLINILCLFLRKDIYFNPIKEKTGQVSLEKAMKEYVSKLQGYFQKLKIQEIKQQKLKKIYAHFIQKMRREYQKNLEGDTKDKEYQKKRNKDMKQRIEKLGQEESLFINNQVKKFIDLFDKVFLYEDEDATWEEVLDSFVDFSAERIINLDEDFQNFHKELWEEEKEKEFYLNRGLSGIKVYIPVKFHAKISELLQYQNWWDFLNEENYNFEHESFCAKLYGVLLQKYEREKGNIREDPIFIKITEYMNKRRALTLDTFSQTSESTHITNYLQEKQKLMKSEVIELAHSQ